MHNIGILVIGIAIGLLASSCFKRFSRNKINAPSYNKDKPFMVAKGIKGEVYSFRKITNLYSIENSPVIQDWSDEGAKIEAVTKSQLISLLTEDKT